MPQILVVGAGQSGLQLALGLQARGHRVTVVTDRSAERIRSGRVLSTQVMFDSARAHERALGLAHWDAEAPAVGGIGVSVADPGGGRALDWLGRLSAPAHSVDQRIKMAHWLEEFATRGGEVRVGAVTAEDLDALSAGYDLTVVAAGRGGLGGLFARDAARSTHDAPRRALAVAYVHGLAPRPEHPFPAVACNLVPGVGELFVIPTLTLTGPADILFLEGVPGGPLDVFDGVTDPGQHLELTRELMKRYLPWEWERARGAELTDAGGTLAGRFPPTVRHPVAVLPSGRPVLGMADVVVANDPITGQGANSAAKAAACYLAAIEERGDGPFDRAFMEAAFERFWDYARHVVRWTDAMLAPPPEHVREILGAAAGLPEVADRFANGFDDPADLAEWFLDPEGAAAYLDAARARRG
ncbi:styrene monooxygenase/indole monooxygenase family protein [Allostreptomyces psammosilenae]|uniref:2-polyprenyl-6-methoxyphenol hydroxylase-like FAD-dependent oxidoreductase n=1 Tax=Allostreptomyces psammosilenae TaxID=1892865 RepID=A0A852ZXA0_9ACTN|nr:styrene monooxygenase/indole monooxygenase family protein [Allostreptomyces psammosilenae]NYI03261.1 2-polyprenyl-6-methoxyphenol hydroxylase-like FAD-dependent oxidoreductase [Allostreptomyces psammosilenae]